MCRRCQEGSGGLDWEVAGGRSRASLREDLGAACGEEERARYRGGVLYSGPSCCRAEERGSGGVGLRLESQGPRRRQPRVQGWVWAWFDGGGVCVLRRCRAGRWGDESGSCAQHELESLREAAAGFCSNQADVSL